MGRRVEVWRYAEKVRDALSAIARDETTGALDAHWSTMVARAENL